MDTMGKSGATRPQTTAKRRTASAPVNRRAEDPFEAANGTLRFANERKAASRTAAQTRSASAASPRSTTASRSPAARSTSGGSQPSKKRKRRKKKQQRMILLALCFLLFAVIVLVIVLAVSCSCAKNRSEQTLPTEPVGTDTPEPSGSPAVSDDTVIDRVEQGLQGLPAVTTMLTDGLTPLEILCRALPGFQLETLGEYDCAYRCNCSRERVERALISAGKDALEEMAQDESTEVKCNFCPSVYRFSPAEIRELLKNAQR